MRMKGLKMRKNAVYKHVLELNLASISALIFSTFSKNSKSLHPTVHAHVDVPEHANVLVPVQCTCTLYMYLYCTLYVHQPVYVPLHVLMYMDMHSWAEDR